MSISDYRMDQEMLIRRSLPADHPYVQMELEEMREQLENEVRSLTS